MGTLIVRHYPTKLFAKAADHTYVMCGTGARAWACWGGKTGGRTLRHAPGSTRRANEIAEPDERAGVTCYLINGVCHQAANRILHPADITVDGARGYSLSVAIFSLYGRERVKSMLCRAPFDSRPQVDGDLLKCMGADMVVDAPQDPDPDRQPFDYTDRIYMSAVREVYAKSADMVPEHEVELLHLQMELFRLFVAHRFRRSRTRIAESRYRDLMEVRERFELERLTAEHDYANSRAFGPFVERFNVLTLQLQQESGEVLDGDEYRTLYDLDRDEHIVLADPDIVPYDHGAEPEPDGLPS